MYGTLRFPEVVQSLLGRVPPAELASVTGWRVAAIPGRVYPALVLAPAAQAPGLLLLDLTPQEWAVLDAFEDAIYDLRVVEVDDGQHAWTYASAAGTQVAHHDWDAASFQTNDLTQYVARCTSWRERFESENDQTARRRQLRSPAEEVT